jgi:formylglycine-generating enzyme required for sulfatase activity
LSGGGKGPALVVIPAGGPLASALAIGKYEVSNSDYNVFCQATGCAPKGGNAANPVTNVSLAQAEAYADWLGTQTNQVYRLPTGAEWEYAAQATGPVAKSANCQLRQGDILIKGSALLDVKTGVANGWGLVNFVGNARELVRGGDARGGAYVDSFDRCDISLKDSGAADEATGFRVLREIK